MSVECLVFSVELGALSMHVQLKTQNSKLKTWS